MIKNNSQKLKELLNLIKKLRSPDGCPWDRKQRKEDIGRYILEEAYEVIDSLKKNDDESLKEELGDLLFQILFIVEISDESDLFSLADVMEGIRNKMIRRHPHVFGDKKVNSVREVKENWQKIKEEEKKDKGQKEDLFAGVPRTLPALMRAQKLTSIASTYGFDWPNTRGIAEKLEEEMGEFNDAVKTGFPEKIEEELGDILFTIVILSRFHSIDAEAALTRTTEKFLQRFSYVTKKLSSLGISLSEANLEQMDALWDEAKLPELKDMR